MNRILITDDCHPDLVDGLSEAGLEVDFIPSLTLEEIDDSLYKYSGIIVNTRVKMDRARINKGVALQFIGRMGSGLDIIDLKYAAEKGIAVISSPEGNATAVGEHSLAMLLSLLNKLPMGAHQIQEMKWDREAARGRQLSGSTVGIIGYGHTGPAFAKAISGIGVTIKAYDKYKTVRHEKLCNSEVILSTMEEILSSCDIMSFNLPLTPETAFLIDETLIGKMKKGMLIINAARGKLMDLGAVIKGLQSGQIGGCCLDVFPNEKTATYTEEERFQMKFLSGHPNVVLTPHVAGWTFESKRSIAHVLVKKILKNFC